MSWQASGGAPGGPASAGNTGYFALAYAPIIGGGAVTGYNAGSMFYLRTDSGAEHTQFGELIPALESASTDKLDLTTAVGSFGATGYTTLAYSPTDIGYGANQFYYLRTDSVTGNTILGRLNPSLVPGTRTISDIANLGSVVNTLTFVVDATGPTSAWGSGNFFVTGAVRAAGTQSVSFAAIADRLVSAGAFTVTPSASSGLAITLTVASGSTGLATISGAGPTFTVTPTAPGLITLQATQAGGSGFTANNLRQSFNVTGAPVITNSPLSAPGTVGSAFSFTITAQGTATSYSASPLPAGLSINTSTGALTGTPSTVGVTSVLLGATNGIGTGNATLTITVVAAGVAPIITNSPLTSAGTVGTPFGFSITASDLPTSYTATPLPAGLSIVGATGVITGTPTIVGTTVVQLGATNTTGTGSATLTINIATSGVAPIILNNPLTAAGTVGTPFGFTVVATGSPTAYSASPLPAGLSIGALTGAITGIPAAAGATTVVLGATNASGTRNATLTITVGEAAAAPVITSPTTATGTAGAPFETYMIAGTGLPIRYTATGLPPGLTLNPLTGAITGTPTTAGTYVVAITAANATGASTATLTITVAGSRIVAFSARSQAGTGDQTLIMGFVVSGNNKTVLVRGLGATLASQGVVNPLADPQIGLYSGATLFSFNDDWGTGPNAGQIPAVSARVGLAAPATTSKESALIEVLNHGVYTARVSGANNTTGTALSEVYDVDSNANTRLIAVSARIQVNTGEGVLIGGLIISGASPKTILIRGIGPTLSAFGVTGVLADPQLTVFSGRTVIGTNDDWGTGNNPATMTAAFAQVGEFALASGSKDAAMLLTLNPGAYTVHLSGVAGATGIGLIEIYDTQ